MIKNLAAALLLLFLFPWNLFAQVQASGLQSSAGFRVVEFADNKLANPTSIA